MIVLSTCCSRYFGEMYDIPKIQTAWEALEIASNSPSLLAFVPYLLSGPAASIVSWRNTIKSPGFHLTS